MTGLIHPGTTIIFSEPIAGILDPRLVGVTEHSVVRLNSVHNALFPDPGDVGILVASKFINENYWMCFLICDKGLVWYYVHDMYRLDEINTRWDHQPWWSVV